MKKLILVVLCLLAPAASAAQKPDVAPYQDATLVRFQMNESGLSCHEGNCSTTSHATYTIDVGGQQITVEPTMSGKQKTKAALTLGWSSVFAKNSCLYGQLPGAHLQIRSESPGIFRVKSGSHESLYRMVEAH